MPVDLSSFEVRMDAPRPPRFLVWAVLFVVVEAAGIALTLYLWPHGERTGTAWFWCCVGAFPLLTWCLLFGLRLHAYEEQCEEYRVLQELRDQDREQAVRFASEPLAVIGMGYLSALGSFNGAAKFLHKEPVLAASVPRTGGAAVRHTSIILPADHETTPLRYRSCFMELLGLCAHAIQSVPESAPFSVLLDVSSDGGQEPTELLDIWCACWSECGFRSAVAELCPAGHGLMPLDAWLDHRGGPALEKYVLLVSAQLHQQPPQDSAEAGVALLLAWAPLAARQGVQAQAMLHRPVEVLPGDVRIGLDRALTWGKATATEVADLWQTGLFATDKPEILQAAGACGLAAVSQRGFSGVHELDVALGYAGSSASLLSVALAVDQAKTSNTPQLIAVRDATLQFAIVQPLANTSQDTEVAV